jgi:hypothetical protein
MSKSFSETPATQEQPAGRFNAFTRIMSGLIKELSQYEEAEIFTSTEHAIPSDLSESTGTAQETEKLAEQKAALLKESKRLTELQQDFLVYKRDYTALHEKVSCLEADYLRKSSSKSRGNDVRFLKGLHATLPQPDTFFVELNKLSFDALNENFLKVYEAYRALVGACVFIQYRIHNEYNSKPKDLKAVQARVAESSSGLLGSLLSTPVFVIQYAKKSVITVENSALYGLLLSALKGIDIGTKASGLMQLQLHLSNGDNRRSVILPNESGQMLPMSFDSFTQEILDMIQAYCPEPTTVRASVPSI